VHDADDLLHLRLLLRHLAGGLTTILQNCFGRNLRTKPVKFKFVIMPFLPMEA
jgi:hypothetical protein